MSNASSVGNVYHRVMQETVDASQMDFQDSGVDPQTLDILRKVWQEKLTAMSVSHFPWEPKPIEPTLAAQAPPEDDKTTLGSMAADGVRIKPEPVESTPAAPPPPPPGQPLSDPSFAAARAAAHVQSVQSKISSVGQLTPQQQQQQQMYAQQQQQMQQQVAQNRPPSQGGPMMSGGLMLPGLPPMRPQHNASIGGQTDGAGDIVGEVIISRLDADGEILRVIAEGDLMRAQEFALRDALNDLKTQSALMEERPVHRKRKNRTARYREPVDVAPSTVAPAMQQTDGPDDNLDEDAINSDLDDTDEEPVDDEDEVEGVQQPIMLCMYDKVQRTKNKWKCVLKDGVMTVNGKEYVFHKANGEYEW